MNFTNLTVTAQGTETSNLANRREEKCRMDSSILPPSDGEVSAILVLETAGVEMASPDALKTLRDLQSKPDNRVRPSVSLLITCL
jgi:hypothetical protein